MISDLRRTALVTGGALCLAIAAAAAIAEPAAPPAPSASASQAPDRTAWPDPAQMRAEKARRLSDILQLRPDQQGALNAFMETATPPDEAERHRMGMGRWDDEGLTAPRRADRMIAHLDEMRTRLAARAQALKTFYAQLTPSQQRAFDAVLSARGHERMMMGGRMMGGGPMHGGPHGDGPDRDR
ncbi:MAG: Spy/CpxP family protein refolding chaperone [Caulobacteraceae bacterium]|nr:Spy/CpxP family protein refolding chaperone [Caulobacteraceae bacterium]